MAKGKQTGRPGLSDAEAERLRELVERLLAERFEGNRTAFARAIGRSQPAVTQLLGGTNKASLETVKRVAEVAGVPYTSLLDVGQGKGAPTTTQYDPRYPAREQAIRMLVDNGEGTEGELEEAADAVAVALSSEEDLTVLAWVDDIRAELRRLRRGGGRVGARQVTTGEAQAEQDETARRFEDALRKGKKKR